MENKGDKGYMAALKAASSEAKSLNKSHHHSPTRKVEHRANEGRQHSRQGHQFALLKEEEEDERGLVKACEEDDDGRVLGEYPNMLTCLENEDVTKLLRCWKEKRQFLCLWYDTTNEVEVREWWEPKELVPFLFSYLLMGSRPNQSGEKAERTFKNLHLVINPGIIDHDTCRKHHPRTNRFG